MRVRNFWPDVTEEQNPSFVFVSNSLAIEASSSSSEVAISTTNTSLNHYPLYTQSRNEYCNNSGVATG